MNKHEERIRNARMMNQNRQKQMRDQGLLDPTSARALANNMNEGLPPSLRPGNVGDIKKVIWPFWFTFNMLELAPNQTNTANLSITQEAAFVWMSYTKTVFLKSAGPVYTYVDPANYTGAGDAPGLNFSLRDSSSTRTFFGNPMPVDSVGAPGEPSCLPTPMLFLPNANVEAIINNQDDVNTYTVALTMFGYRIRVSDAQKILSTVNG